MNAFIRYFLYSIWGSCCYSINFSCILLSNLLLGGVENPFWSPGKWQLYKRQQTTMRKRDGVKWKLIFTWQLHSPHDQLNSPSLHSCFLHLLILISLPLSLLLCRCALSFFCSGYQCLIDVWSFGLFWIRRSLLTSGRLVVWHCLYTTVTELRAMFKHLN